MLRNAIPPLPGPVTVRFVASIVIVPVVRSQMPSTPTAVESLSTICESVIVVPLSPLCSP